MKNVVELGFRQENKVGNIVLNEFVISVTCQMPNVRVASGDEIIDRNHAMTFRQKTIR